MRKFLLYMLLLSVSLPAFAADNEFKFGVTTNTRYNNNVTNVEQGEVDAFIFEIGPRLRFDTRHQKYEGWLSYSPRFATYTDGGRIDEFNQYFGARGEYHLTDQWTFSLQDTFTLQTDADRDFADGVDLDDGSRKQVRRNNLSATTRWSYSQRGSLVFNGGYNIVEREDKDLSDVRSFSGRIQADYVATPRSTIGFGTNLRNQQVDSSAQRDKTTTDYYGFFLFTSYRLTPTFGFQANGGPTWLVSKRQDDDDSGNETDLEYFVNAVVSADFERGTASIEYARASSDVAFSTTTFLIDEVSVNLDWQFSPRVWGGLTGQWNEREAVLRFDSINEVFSNSVTQWVGAATLTVRATPEVLMAFTVDYLRQKQDLRDPAHRVRAVIRFDYNAQAIRF